MKTFIYLCFKKRVKGGWGFYKYVIYHMLNLAFNNMYILQNYSENIAFFRVLASRARAEHTKSSARSCFLNKHIYVFELEFEFLTSQAFIQPSSSLFANNPVWTTYIIMQLNLLMHENFNLPLFQEEGGWGFYKYVLICLYYHACKPNSPYCKSKDRKNKSIYRTTTLFVQAWVPSPSCMRI